MPHLPQESELAPAEDRQLGSVPVVGETDELPLPHRGEDIAESNFLLANPEALPLREVLPIGTELSLLHHIPTMKHSDAAARFLCFVTTMMSEC